MEQQTSRTAFAHLGFFNAPRIIVISIKRSARDIEKEKKRAKYMRRYLARTK